MLALLFPNGLTRNCDIIGSMNIEQEKWKAMLLGKHTKPNHAFSNFCWQNQKHFSKITLKEYTVESVWILEYAQFSKSEKFQYGSPWPFRYDHKKLLGMTSFNVALNSGPHGPFEILVLTVPIG